MLFSVIIPLYNNKSYINQCINSVLSQTYQKYEIIVVDDGSNDGSSEIIDYIAKKNNKIRVIHQENKGQFFSRQLGASLAKGEWCLFLDSDDFWESNLLEEIRKSILNYENIELILFRWNKIKKSGKQESPSVFENNSLFFNETKVNLYKKIVTTAHFNSMALKAIKTKVLEENRLNAIQFIEYRHGEDLLQSLEIFTRATMVLYLDKALYNYRINEGSISFNYNANQFKSVTEVRHIMTKFIVEWGINDKDLMSIFYKNYLDRVLGIIKYSYLNVKNENTRKTLLYEICNNKFFRDAASKTNEKSLNLIFNIQISLLKQKKCRLLDVIYMIVFNNVTFSIKKVFKKERIII